jgi:secreted trypsin-like serine protease
MEIFTSGLILISEKASEAIPPNTVGGRLATLGQFPHHAVIIVGGFLRCGGSLIAREWVLTSAQCAQA